MYSGLLLLWVAADDNQIPQEAIMKVIIDGQELQIIDSDKNIVDIADRAHIGIPALCYRAERNKGWCKSCMVEINGKKQYACTTRSLDGMNIIVNREDLKQTEKEVIEKYREALKSENSGCNCKCSGDEGACR